MVFFRKLTILLNFTKTSVIPAWDLTWLKATKCDKCIKRTITEKAVWCIANFILKSFQMEVLDKTKVVCPCCRDEVSVHQCITSLQYYFQAKHIFADVNNDTSSKSGLIRLRWTTLAECNQGRSVNNVSTCKLTNAIAKWIAIDFGWDFTSQTIYLQAV